MKTILVGVGVLVVAGLLIVMPLISSRNDLVTEKNDIDGKWAQVDNDMKRRADMIPNLVETVKGYAKQEQSVITAVADARAAMLGAGSSGNRASEIKANDQLSGALGRLLVLQENYPDLKSNQNFLRLQDELTGTENRIAISRRDYNLAVQHYNTDVELFPKNLAAGIFGFKRDDAYFKTTEEEKKVPQVKF
jgi:LemA protein